MSSQDQGIVTRNRMAYEENLQRVKKVKIISIINNIVLLHMLRFVFSPSRRPLLDPADLPRSKLAPKETPLVQTGAR